MLVPGRAPSPRDRGVVRRENAMDVTTIDELLTTMRSITSGDRCASPRARGGVGQASGTRVDCQAIMRHASPALAYTAR
jgi:hypothetical protein